MKKDYEIPKIENIEIKNEDILLDSVDIDMNEFYN